MHLDTAILAHPSSRQLVEFAESLVDRRSPVSALMAAHVAGCPRCTAEVKRMRASLELVSLAGIPEASSDLTRKILNRVRQERQALQETPRRESPVSVLAARALFYLAAGAALAFLSFSSALSGLDRPRPGPSSYAARAETAPLPSREGLARQTMQAESLSSAVASQLAVFRASPIKQERQRALELYSRDIHAALVALERNPGCVRASQIVRNSLERKIEGLRSLYLSPAHQEWMPMVWEPPSR